jgi:nucleotide-binding universal stress UspA family protein
LDSGADLVIMGAYGHSPIRHLMMGSTTTSVLLSLELPILLFR